MEYETKQIKDVKDDDLLRKRQKYNSFVLPRKPSKIINVKCSKSTVELDKLEINYNYFQKVRAISLALPSSKLVQKFEDKEDIKRRRFTNLNNFIQLKGKNTGEIKEDDYDENKEVENNIIILNHDEEKKIIDNIKIDEEEILIKKSKLHIPVRSSDQLRKIYYSKLIHKKFWNPSSTKRKNHTIIIFDWDDTLLPTTFLTPGGEYNDQMVLSNSESEQFKLMEKAVYKVLTLALEKGDTYIITNAAPGWVEFTSNKYYPSIIRLLQKVKVMSARGGYEKLYPKDYRQWKIQTFLEMKKDFDSYIVTNIICMGDSMIEMEAGHLLSSKFSKAYIKTIKFRESPRLKVLYKQLLMIIDKFNEIYLTLKSLAISIDKKSR